jgi:glycosyltransferase involved in cell wall biosynthesis
MFTIVVPLWNNRDTVREAVASVLAQTYEDFELIVVDDASTDGSLDMLAGVDDPRLRILRQPNGGPGLARNAGIAAAKADWIAFLDADDLWLPDHLAELDRVRARFPRAGLIGTSYIWARPGRRMLLPRQAPGRLEAINYFERVAGGGEVLLTSSAAVQRRAVDAIGGFGDGESGEDTRYWMRIALGFPVAASSRRTVVYRPSAKGLSAAVGERWRGQPLAAPADVSHRVAFLLDHQARASRELRRGIERFIDQDFRWCLRSSAKSGDLVTVRALRPLYLRPPRGWDRLLIAAGRLPDPMARFIYRAAAAIIPPLRRLGRRLSG